MKRKDFLKRLGLISAVAVTAPALASELFKEKGTRVTLDLSDEKVAEINNGLPITLSPKRLKTKLKCSSGPFAEVKAIWFVDKNGEYQPKELQGIANLYNDGIH